MAWPIEPDIHGLADYTTHHSAPYTLRTQVPRILNPVVLVLDELPKLCKDAQASAVQSSAGLTTEHGWPVAPALPVIPAHRLRHHVPTLLPASPRSSCLPGPPLPPAGR